MIKSPLNYTGGKFRLLPQILPLLPPCNTFYDVCCGGFNVGVNANAQQVVAVDCQCQIIDLYQTWQRQPIATTLLDLEVLRAVYGLSKTDQDGYLRLRAEYNRNRNALLFYGLITTSFNHQIRFNSRGEFNMPFGKDRSSYNDKLRSHLIKFITAIQEKNVQFICDDFTSIKPSPGDFVYCDPPYLIADAAYNENGGWESDKKLLDFLDGLHAQGIGFAMSNTTVHRGVRNELLIAWAEKYHVHHLNMNYGNCSYHKLDRLPSDEVVITNTLSPGCQFSAL